jgi:hypothetical protein
MGNVRGRRRSVRGRRERGGGAATLAGLNKQMDVVAPSR